MNLVRWSPFPEFEAIDRRMRRMLDEFGIVPTALPAADVYDTDRAYAFELEVPGFEEKELTVEVSDHTLVVKGERLETKDEKDKHYRLHERLEKTFERRFELPSEADAENIDAEFTEGVLTVHAPKVETLKPRAVAIAAKTLGGGREAAPFRAVPASRHMPRAVTSRTRCRARASGRTRPVARPRLLARCPGRGFRARARRRRRRASLPLRRRGRTEEGCWPR